MDPAQTRALLHDYLQLSAIELLTDVGAAFASTQSSEWTPDITAILGFAGSGIAGSVALCTSSECLQSLAELGHSTTSEDWLGELSNQLLGRYKRRLSPHGASFSLGTPLVVRGDRLRLATRIAQRRTVAVYLDSTIGRVEVWLEVEFRNGFELEPEPKDDGTLIEGEALLF